MFSALARWIREVGTYQVSIYLRYLYLGICYLSGAIQSLSAVGITMSSGRRAPEDFRLGANPVGRQL